MIESSSQISVGQRRVKVISMGRENQAEMPVAGINDTTTGGNGLLLNRAQGIRGRAAFKAWNEARMLNSLKLLGALIVLNSA
jgi:hypothetical protein